MPLSLRERAVAALASALILFALVAALVIGLAPPLLPGTLMRSLVAFAVPPPASERQPVRRPPPKRAAPAAAAGGSERPRGPAPTPAVLSLPSPLVIVSLPAPIGPVLPAPSERAAEASRAGSGSGTGAGTGVGRGAGVGTGDGAPAGPAVHARQVHGHLSPGDVPDGVLPPGGSGGVTVRYVVGIDGRVSGCTVTAPSGVPQIDRVPCPLIARRFRFRPARDTQGRAVAETIVETHTWFEPERRDAARSSRVPTLPGGP